MLGLSTLVMSMVVIVDFKLSTRPILLNTNFHSQLITKRSTLQKFLRMKT